MSEASLKKNLSIILTAIILLSGMYFAWNKADSSFGDSADWRQAFAHHISNNSVFLETLCTGDLLDDRIQSSILTQLQRVSEKRDPEITVMAADAGLISTFAIHLSETSLAEQSERCFGPQMIVNYIHHQDGQKG